MRFRIALLAACALALAGPAVANAAFTVGISENQPSMFDDPIFQSLGAKQARVVVEYNVALEPGSVDYVRLAAYLQKAQAQGVETLVAFEHPRGDASRCNQKKNFKQQVCALPTQKQYEKAFKAFLAAFPAAKTIAPWNEANHFTQPTSRDPKAAAGFTNTVAKDCKTCTIVVADILDQADDPSAKHPTFVNTSKFIKTFRGALKTSRSICGIHNYSDVNRFRTTGTTALMKALGCKQYWLTETGGIYHFGSFWSKSTYNGCKSAASCQLKATKYMFSVAKARKTIKRVYVYTWFAGAPVNGKPARFDSGLVTLDGVARPALAEVKKHL